MARRTIYLLAFDGMSDCDASFATAGIRDPRFQRDAGRYEIVTVACSRKPIVTMGGLRVLPDIILQEIDASNAAMLILPGGETWECGDSEAIGVARGLFLEGIPVAAIGKATRALACAGMLDDFHHTGNGREYLASTGYRGINFYCDVPAITDERVITASALAPLEFAREIFRELGLYDRRTLAAWYAMFKFGDASGIHQIADYRAA